MKNAFIVASLLAMASALPRLAKRDVVWVTDFDDVVVTEWLTSTVWVNPNDATPISAAGFQGYEHPTTTTNTHAAPMQSSIFVAPAPAKNPHPVAHVKPPPPPSFTSTSTYVAPTPTSTYVAPKPTTPTSTYVAPTSANDAPAIVAYPAASPVSALASSGSNSASSSGSNSGSSSSASSTFSGDGTFYAVGLGSCGLTSVDSEAVVAVGHRYMQQSYSGNPNLNPLCGKSIKVTYGGVTKTAVIVDTCPGCPGLYDLDMSTSLFDAFASEAVGRIHNVEWTFV